jgi:hypothetical protein
VLQMQHCTCTAAVVDAASRGAKEAASFLSVHKKKKKYISEKKFKISSYQIKTNFFVCFFKTLIRFYLMKVLKA